MKEWVEKRQPLEPIRVFELVGRSSFVGTCSVGGCWWSCCVQWV